MVGALVLVLVLVMFAPRGVACEVATEVSMVHGVATAGAFPHIFFSASTRDVINYVRCFGVQSYLSLQRVLLYNAVVGVVVYVVGDIGVVVADILVKKLPARRVHLG